ncbi:FAD-dependent oxidoreductase [Neisseriaceae bacterium B1]
MPNRRQFLAYGGTLVASAAASWLGYRYLSKLPSVHVNKVGLPLAHLLRDKQLNVQANRVQQANIVILGSGTAGLSAAWHLAQAGEQNVLLIEGFEPNGNNAAYVSGSLKAPTGAHYLPQPSQESVYVRRLLRQMGILLQENADGSALYRETDLVHAPDERVYYQGRWHDGLLPPDEDSRRFFAFAGSLKHAYGSDGRKAFAIPIVASSGDEKWRALDQLTFADWLRQNGYKSANLLSYLDYCCRDDYGQGAAQVSAFAGLHYFAARGNDNAAVLTWADGLNHLSQGLRDLSGMQRLKRLPENENLAFRQPQAMAGVAIAVREYDDFVEIILRDEVGNNHAIHARQVICAMPLMVAKRIIHQPERYGLQHALPDYAPWLVSNFVLNSFPPEPDKTELAWDNIVHQSPSLGYVVATHQQIRVAKPSRTIFTAYHALNHDTPQNVRQWLLNAQAQDLIEPAAQDLLRVYGGKRFWQHVAHVDMTVRAHAMSVPQVGYLSHVGLNQIRHHHSRLHFAHSDLSGYSVFEEALHWGVNAAQAVFKAA